LRRRRKEKGHACQEDVLGKHGHAVLVIMAERILYRSVHARFKVKRPTPSFAYSWVTLR